MVHPLEVLQGTEWRALEVDPENREAYLDNATFRRVFGTSRAQFAALPKWKRNSKKKEARLF